ncbi:MAG: hypothetical protein H6702_18675 [Myxococcales bacterium]|nr:hypothetical protein [Myxococcales bacterium]
MMTPTPTAADARAARLTELLDGALSDADARELEALLAEDAEAADELAAAREAHDLLGALAPKAPPRDFVRKVQRRLRRRSGGRFFHPAQSPMGAKLSVEVFSVIAVVVMAACWMFLEAERRAQAGPGPLVEVPAEQRPAPKAP